MTSPLSTDIRTEVAWLTIPATFGPKRYDPDYHRMSKHITYHIRHGDMIEEQDGGTPIDEIIESADQRHIFPIGCTTTRDKQRYVVDSMFLASDKCLSK